MSECEHVWEWTVHHYFKCKNCPVTLSDEQAEAMLNEHAELKRELADEKQRNRSLETTPLHDNYKALKREIVNAIAVMDEKGRKNQEGNSTMLWNKEWDQLRFILFTLLTAEEIVNGDLA